MVIRPKTHDETVSVAELREFFSDDHIHEALIVSGRHLVSMVKRGDLVGVLPNLPAAPFGRLSMRTISSDYDLDWAYLEVIRAGRR